MTFNRAVHWIQYNGDRCPPDINLHRWAAMVSQIRRFFQEYMAE